MGKFWIILAFIAIARAARLESTKSPILNSISNSKKELESTKVDTQIYPEYKYVYDVQDNLSGDTKGHTEERSGDVVRGEYSLIDPDGFRRIVTYTADAVNGFNAVVRRERIVSKPNDAKTVKV